MARLAIGYAGAGGVRPRGPGPSSIHALFAGEYARQGRRRGRGWWRRGHVARRSNRTWPNRCAEAGGGTALIAGRPFDASDTVTPLITCYPPAALRRNRPARMPRKTVDRLTGKSPGLRPKNWKWIGVALSSSIGRRGGWGCVDPQPRHSPGSPNGETKRRCKVSGGRSGRAQGPLPAEWPGDPTHALRKAAPELQSAVAQFAPLFLGGGGAFLFAHGSGIAAARADVPRQQREVYLS
jgi:hypothetical protein